MYDDFTGVTDPTVLQDHITKKYKWATRAPDHPNVTSPPPGMKPLDVRATYFFSTVGDKKPEAAPAGAAAASNFAATSASKFTWPRRPTSASPSGSGHQERGAAAVATTAAPPKIDPSFDREWYVDSVVRRYVLSFHPPRSRSFFSCRLEYHEPPPSDPCFHCRSAANGIFTLYFFITPPSGGAPSRTTRSTTPTRRTSPA